MLPSRVVPVGDSAVQVRLPPRIDPQTNDWCLALARAIRAEIGGLLRDVVVGYCTVTVYFDPLAIDGRWVEAEVRSLATHARPEDAASGATVEVPVCYGGELGPDIEDVARFGSCTEADVIALHSGVEYRVYVVGFVPGFAYMAEVDPRIAAPRRSAPRTAVPPGSVAIAGGQTGVYPSSTPGGWNIIGRTPVRPYDPERAEPFLFKVGDRVRFKPIDRDEFDRLANEAP